jgi:hypothetical protein
VSLSHLASTRRLLACADLLASTEALSRYAEHGMPQHLSDGEPATTILSRVVDAVSPSDLPGGYRVLWTSACRTWSKGKQGSLEQAAATAPLEAQEEAARALAYVRAHGMNIALYAPVAARQVVSLSRALDSYDQARAAAAEALTEAESILGSVSGA